MYKWTLATGLANAAAIAGTAFGQITAGGGGGGAGGTTYPVSPATGLPEPGETGGATYNFYFEGETINDREWLERWAERFTEAVENNELRLVASEAKQAEKIL
jgi:hypothetical protein